mgnify:CR=1 FL=1
MNSAAVNFATWSRHEKLSCGRCFLPCGPWPSPSSVTASAAPERAAFGLRRRCADGGGAGWPRRPKVSDGGRPRLTERAASGDRCDGRQTSGAQKLQSAIIRSDTFSICHMLLSINPRKQGAKKWKVAKNDLPALLNPPGFPSLTVPTKPRKSSSEAQGSGTRKVAKKGLRESFMPKKRQFH